MRALLRARCRKGAGAHAADAAPRVARASLVMMAPTKRTTSRSSFWRAAPAAA